MARLRHFAVCVDASRLYPNKQAFNFSIPYCACRPQAPCRCISKPKTQNGNFPKLPFPQ